MGSDEVGDAIAAVGAAIDVLLAADLDAIGDAGLADVLEAMEQQRRRLDAVDTRLVAAVERNHIASRHCRASTADLLIHRLRLSPREARARVRRAQDLGPRQSLTGESLESIHPVLAAAQERGEISTQHVDEATKMLGRIPADISVEATPVAEKMLVEIARHDSPAMVARMGAKLLDRLDPDGAEPDEQRAYLGRKITLHRRTDGTWTLRGTLTDEAGLVLQTVLDPLAKPWPLGHEQADDHIGRSSGEAALLGIDPAAHDARRDARTVEQRTHDALFELGTRILRGGRLPDTESGDAGSALTMLVRVDGDDLADPNGLATTDHGDEIRLRALINLAGDCTLVPVTFDRAYTEQQLMLGRTRRLANRAQRRALRFRDGGCSFPACTRPASWCEVHHVIEWRDGGATDITNLCLLCPFHHREFNRRGWRVDMVDDRPHWTPPYWLDSERKPRLNTAHHHPEIVFTPDGRLEAARCRT